MSVGAPEMVKQGVGRGVDKLISCHPPLLEGLDHAVICEQLERGGGRGQGDADDVREL